MLVRPIRNGFSLPEILVAIVLLAILVTTSYLFAPLQIKKANDARRKADLYKIKTFLEIYYSFAEQFPQFLPECGQPLVYKNQVILDSMPCDPVTKKPYYYQVKNSNLQSYRLYTSLSNVQDTSIAQIGCVGGCGPGCSFNYGVSSMNIGLTRCSYVCAPGGGQSGACELYQDTGRSICPKLYSRDSTCNKECGTPQNRCKNASGKHAVY